jgi:hypothetical protein
VADAVWVKPPAIWSTLPDVDWDGSTRAKYESIVPTFKFAVDELSAGPESCTA